MTYVCSICDAINAGVKFSCSCCGAIPRKYSWNGKIIRRRVYVWDGVASGLEDVTTVTSSVEVVKAHGAELQTRYRAVKHSIRTVPMDYYASE